MSKLRAHIFVSGRVQGISFRWRTKQKAQKIGISGWVRNLLDGRVEMTLEAEKEKLEELINWIKSEPFLTKVDDLEISWEEHKGEFNNFIIKY